MTRGHGARELAAATLGVAGPGRRHGRGRAVPPSRLRRRGVLAVVAVVRAAVRAAIMNGRAVRAAVGRPPAVPVVPAGGRRGRVVVDRLRGRGAVRRVRSDRRGRQGVGRLRRRVLTLLLVVLPLAATAGPERHPDLPPHPLVEVPALTAVRVLRPALVAEARLGLGVVLLLPYRFVLTSVGHGALRPHETEQAVPRRARRHVVIPAVSPPAIALEAPEEARAAEVPPV